jgi:hypothetical protein
MKYRSVNDITVEIKKRLLSTIIFQAPQPLSSIDADANGKPIGLALL